MKRRQSKKVKILEVGYCIVIPTISLPSDKADAFIQTVKKELGEIGIRKGGESTGQEGKYILLSIYVPPSKREQLYNLLRNFCKENNLPLSEETLQ